CTRERLIDFW
nr:immunoglobulin heavy chain junction region [Mus musculus]MBK4186509.1 immunoglobulin heavy chain junction region [Mus musculus]MBK4186510.1 immunoglobulin heavy chain junction region [Mus musculus]